MIPIESITYEVSADGAYPRNVTITPGRGSYGMLVSEEWYTPIFSMVSDKATVVHSLSTKGGNSVEVSIDATNLVINLKYPISKRITLIMFSDIDDIKTGLTDLHVIAQIDNEITLTSATIQNLADAIARALPST